MTHVPTGYQANLAFWAERYPQDRFSFVSFKLPVETIINGMIQKPDPDKPEAANRRMTKAHAVAFGDYVRNHRSAFIPPLFVWATNDEIGFETNNDIASPGFGIDFGLASLNRAARLRILDGQHRTFGLYDTVEKLNQAIDTAEAALRAGESNTPDLVPELKKKLEHLKGNRARVLGMVVEVTVAVVGGRDDAKQLFVDMADNQKGMNPTVTAGFDRRKMYNRVAADISENEASLAGLIDFERPRPARGNWATLNDVAVICQTIAFGLGGRWSQAKEDELDEALLRRRCVAFYDTLVTAFPELGDVLVARSVPPEELRQQGPRQSLTGSMTFVRVLAVVWNELQMGRRGKEASLAKLSPTEVTQFFRSLPTTAGEDDGRRALDDRWVTSGLFRRPWSAPSARQGDLRRLTNFILDWARSGEPTPLVPLDEVETDAAVGFDPRSRGIPH
jgi:hypothetical protein